MKLRESVRIGWRAITGHKLRSTLTTVGVIIGIASVIVFMVLGGAFTENVVGDLDDESEPVMQVVTQTEPETGTGIMFVEAPIYTESDVEAIEGMDGVDYVAPSGSLPAVQLSHGEESQTGTVGVEATIPERFGNESMYPLEDGETFSPSADDEAVVSGQVARLFEDNVSVGDELSITFEDGETETVTAVGIANTTVGGQPSQPTVYLPVDSHYELTIETPDGETERAYPSLEVRAESMDDVDPTKEAITEYFETDADARELKDDEHTIAVQTVDDAVDQVAGIVDQLTVFIGGIAAISLVVGSIGIANIMIVSVTERTREIGVMKAVGARKRDIVQLFLLESVILGAIGAVVGVAAGIGLGYLAVSMLGWPMVYPLQWIAIAAAVGVGVGVLSGLYPAWRAASVDPIEALRRE
ncbi:ABC transporter permease [Saliphagus infecundisoli]|uniref:ABC transporter permease n=1 Tax=Saliphagus infecundisoli TaxID=1849069 RepID=A0ABD5QES9_9EURY|nr:ABC transporter permease [Saliphagus infecundisoli]